MRDSHHQICLATCEHHPGFVADDDTPLLNAFNDAGCDAHLLRWDEEHDWAFFDAVILRTTWDYTDRLDEFLAWCERVTSVSRLFNPLETIRANIRKTYLRELEVAGVPVVPTIWMDTGARRSIVRQQLSASGWPSFIVKPSVGAGASGLLKVDGGDVMRALTHADTLLPLGPVMFQPMLETIRTRGELSVVLIDGVYSHAVRKVPKDGEIRVQIEFGATYTPEDAGDAEREIAHSATAWASAAGEPPLYARIDLVTLDDGTPVVIEAELIEPELFFPNVPEAAKRFVEATLRRLQRTHV
ncbi:MAG: hypothetical protein AAGD00_01645 [Planctomycetota bacterium]